MLCVNGVNIFVVVVLCMVMIIYMIFLLDVNGVVFGMFVLIGMLLVGYVVYWLVIVMYLVERLKKVLLVGYYELNVYFLLVEVLILIVSMLGV